MLTALLNKDPNHPPPEDRSINDNDKKLITRGIQWNFLQLVVNQSFAFVLKLILAKLLFPAQFGLVGMAVVFTGFVQVLNDLGIGAALVQRKKNLLHSVHFHTAFWTGVFWSVLLFLIMSLAVAPLASLFYAEPMLKTIIPVLSLGILVSPVNLVHKARLTRQMNFKKLAFIDNTANLVSGIIAIALAFSGAGVWALVFNSVAAFFVAMPLFFKITKWVPRFIWNKQAFKDIFGFGIYTTGSNVLNYLYNNIDYLLIGKLLGSVFLGVYTLAFVLTDTFRNKLMTMINTVMFPAYGKMQHDFVSLKKYYLKAILFNCVLVYPVMIFFITQGPAFVTTVFGNKWSQTVMPLQILSISALLHTLVSGNTVLLRSLGRPGMEMKQQILKALIFLPTLGFGIYYYGITGAVFAVLINKVVVILVAQYTFNYLIPVKISFFDLLSAIKAPLIATLLMFFAGYVLSILNVNFIISGLLSFFIYLGVLFLMMGNELRSAIKAFLGLN